MEKFTPIFDGVARKYGLGVAAVYGAIWRACQLSQSECTKANKTIANELGVSTSTVTRHVGELEAAGVIVDLMNGGKTNARKIIIDPSQFDTPTQSNLTQHPSQIDTTPTSICINTQSNLTYKETETNKETIEETKETVTAAADYSNVFKAYLENIGNVTGIMADSLKDLADEHGAQVVIDAITTAVKAEKRSLRYVEGVLKGWKRDGRNATRANRKAAPEAFSGWDSLAALPVAEDDEAEPAEVIAPKPPKVETLADKITRQVNYETGGRYAALFTRCPITESGGAFVIKAENSAEAAWIASKMTTTINRVIAQHAPGAELKVQ